MDIREAIAEFRDEFQDRPDLETLLAVRQRLDDPAFADAIREYYRRRHNDPSVRIEFLAALQGLLRAAQDHRSNLDYEVTRLGAIGIGGGVGLVGGSVVAAATAAFPIVALIPILGGAVMAGVAFLSGRVLNRQRTVLEHICETIERVKLSLEDAGTEDDNE